MSGTGVVCDVEGFALGLVSLNYVEIMSVETAYDNVDMGETYILVYAQIREFGTILKTYLAPPNQLWAAGIILDDVPNSYKGGSPFMGYTSQVSTWLSSSTCVGLCPT